MSGRRSKKLFLAAHVQEKGAEDCRAFLTCLDDDGKRWELRGYGKWPAAAVRDAWMKFRGPCEEWDCWGCEVAEPAESPPFPPALGPSLIPPAPLPDPSTLTPIQAARLAEWVTANERYEMACRRVEEARRDAERELKAVKWAAERFRGQGAVHEVSGLDETRESFVMVYALFYLTEEETDFGRTHPVETYVGIFAVEEAARRHAADQVQLGVQIEIRAESVRS